MTTTSRPAGAVSEQDAPPSVGSSMPPELACEMARAGELLDLGDRVGARRIVRRVLDRAAPELLAELADLATDLGLGEEDLGTAAVRRALRWVPPTRVRRRPVPAPGLAGLAGPRSTWPQDTRSGRPATRRGRDGGGEVASYLATRGGVDDAAERGERPTATPSTTTAPPWSARRRRCARVATWSAPRPTSPAATGCARTAAPTGSAVDPMVVRCEAILAAAVRRGPWARRELRRLWNGADAADRATVAAWVAAHDAAHPPGPARPLTRASRAPGPVTSR